MGVMMKVLEVEAGLCWKVVGAVVGIVVVGIVVGDGTGADYVVMSIEIVEIEGIYVHVYA